MNEKYVAIIDYGVGNLGSVENMIKKMGYQSVITSNTEIINKSSKIILPGVGSFDNAIKKLKSTGLFDVINYNVLKLKKPILGICLGMQLLGKSSREGNLKGFGFLDFECLSFSDLGEKSDLKVPNMGWRDVKVLNSCSFTSNINSESRFYFVHSYYVPINDNYTVLSTKYGVNYTAALVYNNIFGTQFHPEKSHKYGMQILKNFIEVKNE